MFTRSSPARLVSLLFVLTLMFTAGAAGVAHAQFTPGTQSYGPLVGGKGTPRGNAPKLPAALPGTVNQDRGASDRSTSSDLPPTEALFDAINRGDMLSARDALSRGADLNGTNVLGMTPIDLSVDLSRNDITFLLLSMRGAQPSSALPPGSVPPPPGKTVSGKLPAPPPAPPRQVLQATSRAPRAVSDVAVNRPPVGSGGNPNAASGFLGFGG